MSLAKAKKVAGRDARPTSICGLPTFPPFTRRFWIIVALALAVRLAYQLSTRNSPFFDTFQLDAAWHARWADEIAAGHWAQDRPFFRAPLYPFFLAAAKSLTGSFDGARCVQHLLGALSCGLIFLLGRRAGGTVVAWTAGLVASLYGPLIYYENELLTSSLEVFLLTAALGATANAVDRPSRWRWLLAGMLLGLGAITRPTFLLLVPVMAIWWLLTASQQARRARIAHVAALGVGLAIPIIPVAWHNRVYGGEWVLIASQGGVNFYIGNNPDSDGRTARAVSGEIVQDDEFVDNVWMSSRAAAERAMGRPLREKEVSDYWYGRAFEFWREAPGRAIALTLRKTYYLFNGFEVHSLRSLYLDGDFARLPRLLTWCLGLAFPAGLIIPLALVGVIFPVRDNRLLTLWRWIGIAYAAGVVAFFVNSRLRIPLAPLAIIFAARGSIELFRRVRGGKARGTIPHCVALLALILACNSSFLDVRNVDRAADEAFVANAFRMHGDFPNAVVHFQNSLAIAPDQFLVRHNLGVALQRIGRAGDAVEELRQAVRLRPDHAAARNSLATALEDAGKPQESRLEYAEAIRVDPRYVPAYLNAGKLAFREKRFADTVDLMRQVITRNPGCADCRLLLGLALLEQGQSAAAEKAFDEFARGQPEPSAAYRRVYEILNESGHSKDGARYLEKATGRAHSER